MKKITWAKFRKALIKNGINPDNTAPMWKLQLHYWNCGERKGGYGAIMHDNALSTLSELERESE